MISTTVEERLRSLGQYGKTPTDLDALLGDADLTLIEDDPGRIQEVIQSLRLSERGKRTLNRGLNKVKGAIGLRERVVWVKPQGNHLFERFPKAHELTHGVLPWHDTSQIDDHFTLSPEVRATLERQANFGASEFLFQCRLFKDKAEGKHESIDAALALADEHAATRASTLWRYVQVHDRALALLAYKKCDGGYAIRRAVLSPKFEKTHSGLLIPDKIPPDHEWVARDPLSNAIKRGDSHFQDGKGRFKFDWQSWTNQYDYFVLLSKASKLHLIGNVVWPFQKATA